MKKIYLTLITLIVLMQLAKAQWTTSGTNIYNSNTGFVGIGTTAPSSKLHINTSSTIALSLSGNTGSWVGADLMISRVTANANIGSAPAIQLFDAASGLSSMMQSYQGNLQLFISNSAGWNQAMQINNSGQVGIGTTSFSSSYLLGVNGNIVANGITVKQYPWADYVFKPTYHLSTLQDVKTYIDENHHLPELPSEADVSKNGLNLGEMNKVLVKKVEELTLYAIAADQKIKEAESVANKQQALLMQMQQQLNIQQQEIEKLKTNK